MISSYKIVLWDEIRFVQTESRHVECQMNKINFHISLAWAEEGIDVGHNA